MKKQKEIKIIKCGSFDIDTLSEQEQKTFYMTLLAHILKLYIKQIKVYNDCIEVELNTPTPKSPDDDNNQGFFFYDNLVKKPTYSANGKFAGFEKIRIRIKI